MKKILAVLIAVLMICLSVVPAMAAGVASGGLDPLGLVQYAIKTFGEASSRIHEAYADTIQKAMDYRKYYNEQGLAKAYDKMQVSMRNTGTPSYKSVLNTTNNTFYDMSRDYTYTYNTAYYNNTYNSYYIPVTYNDVDYNYFITYAPTYTNITYIVDGCNDPSQAVSNNYYFQLPDGRNSYNLIADDVFGIPLAGEVINYDAVPENDNCVALYHFDGNIIDASGNSGIPTFTVGSVPQYTSHSGYGQCLTFSGEGNLSIPVTVPGAYTVEFSMNLGQYVTFKGRNSFPLKSERKWEGTSQVMIGPGSDRIRSNDPAVRSQSGVFFYADAERVYNHDICPFLLSSGEHKRFGILYVTKDFSCFPGFNPDKYYAFGNSTNPSYLGEVFKEVDFSTLYSPSGGNVSSILNSYISSIAKDVSQISFTFDYSNNGEHRNNLLGIPQGQWLKCAYVFDGTDGKFYINGVRSDLAQRCFMSTGDMDSITLHGCDGFSYVMYDELRVSKGALYTSNYTPASAPFDIPMALVLPSEKTECAIAVKSAVAVNNVRLGGVRPSYPAQGDVYIYLDADKKVTSCQQYQSGTWTECQGSVCDNDTWVDLSGYSFAGQVVNEDDFAEVVDKKDDPAIGSNSNPDAEVTSFTVHYYKDGTTDKLRRDTVYQNVAVGSSFTFSPPAIKNYKPLVSSAEITISADGEHIFYYAADAGSGGGSGGESDPSKPGFFDGLLSGVKSLVDVVCGFLGGVVQSVLSGITGIISTLIEAFKAVLSLGGHFGDFLAAALGFVPREIIDLLIAGIAVSIALAIVKFIRG